VPCTELSRLVGFLAAPIDAPGSLGPDSCLTSRAFRSPASRHPVVPNRIASTRRVGLLFWQFWQWSRGARLVFRAGGVRRRPSGVRVGRIHVLQWICQDPHRGFGVVSPAAAQTCPGFRLADIADRGLERPNWADCGPTGVASGRTGVRAVAAIPLRARNSSPPNYGIDRGQMATAQIGRSYYFGTQADVMC
jgi:hypothetical protein